MAPSDIGNGSIDSESISCFSGVGFMNICEIRRGMKNAGVEGKIVDKNDFMLLISDKTGQIFVRYWRDYRPNEEWQKLLSNLKIGNKVKITNVDAVNYGGILQLKLTRKGQVALISFC